MLAGEEESGALITIGSGLTGGVGKTAKAGVLFPVLLCGQSPNEWSLEPQAINSQLAIRQFQRM